MSSLFFDRDRKEKEENNRKYEESLKNRDLKKTEFEKTNISKSPSKQETKVIFINIYE